MAGKQEYLFGPVPSRRLGLSLGVDIVPFKVCPLDCIYCQLGPTTAKSIKRRDYVPVDAVLAELKRKLSQGVKADFITISGSGEPTLNSNLGQIIEGIKKLTNIPVAVLTNGVLFTDQSVRSDCARADVVLPSLDAGDEDTFQRINRPCKEICSINRLIDGLSKFRDEFSGQIWLEVFLIEGVNTGSEQLSEIKAAIERIRPDKIQLNTAVRPTTLNGVKRLEPERLKAIAGEFFDDMVEIVADFSRQCHGGEIEKRAEDVLSILKRRPCTMNDICSGLGIHRNEVLKYISHFKEQGTVESTRKDGKVFYTAC